MISRLGNYRYLALMALTLLGTGHVQADTHPSAMKEDKSHVSRWNRFVAEVHALHQRFNETQALSKSTSIGGYASQPNYYLQEEYRDQQGRLVSRLQWERAHPENLHAIEVNVYDQQGRVIRDYAGAYLPFYRNAPTQTLVSLYAYNQGLVAFRTFDASAEFVYERCSGMFKGKAVGIELDIDEKEGLMGRPNTVLTSPAYRACFKGLAEGPGVYLQPQ